MVFKIGDTIKLVRQSIYTGIEVGDVGTIISDDGMGSSQLRVRIDKDGLEYNKGMKPIDIRWELVKAGESDGQGYIIQINGRDERKYMTIQEVIHYIKRELYISEDINDVGTYEELEEYIDEHFSDIVKLRRAKKTREDLIYERMKKVKREVKKFKVGVRVMAKGEVEGIDLSGYKGTIVRIREETDYTIGVDFDCEIEDGHNCNGYSRSENGRYCRKEDLALI